MITTTPTYNPGRSQAESMPQAELVEFNDTFPQGELLDDRGFIDDATVLHNTLERIAMYCKCQCTSVHGDNEHCPVLMAQQGLIAAGISEAVIDDEE